MAIFHGNFSLHFGLFLMVILAGYGKASEQCPQQKGGKEDVNSRARKLAGTDEFVVYDDKKIYSYTINLCHGEALNPVVQIEVKNTTNYYVVGTYEGAQVLGGTNWLMIIYGGGQKYHHHCDHDKRRAIISIICDSSADNKEKRKARVLEEYRAENGENAYCYYLFEMSHNAACSTQPKAKISPGSVFIIIVLVAGTLYLVLGLLYQRFIVGAKGLEQIPNYLMWREFGTLQADGCNFMCRCKGTRGPTRYKPMDDAIADDDDEEESEDKDDTLLPM